MNKVLGFFVQSALDALELGKWTAIFTVGILTYASFANVLAWNPAPPAFYSSDTGLCDSGCSDLR